MSNTYRRTRKTAAHYKAYQLEHFEDHQEISHFVRIRQATLDKLMKVTLAKFHSENYHTFSISPYWRLDCRRRLRRLNHKFVDSCMKDQELIESGIYPTIKDSKRTGFWY